MEKMITTNYKKKTNSPNKNKWVKNMSENSQNIKQPTNIWYYAVFSVIGKIQIKTAMKCQLHHKIGKRKLF